MNPNLKAYLMRYLIYIAIGMAIYLIDYITHPNMKFIPSFAFCCATGFFADYLFQDWLHSRFGKMAFFITVIVFVVGYIIGVKVAGAISNAAEGFYGLTPFIYFFVIIVIYIGGYVAYVAESAIRRFFIPR
ncbi:hypothetical protein [Butyrivibrio sp. AE2015]|uniref:hypothetical protein n=1 Tax=Butyrivibrio sp. AE2015 TaxID=1280663 RepID=UPI0003B56B55|nr:hypothetical protein [Butyrivibrio sp. AE2015]